MLKIICAILSSVAICHVSAVSESDYIGFRQVSPRAAVVPSNCSDSSKPLIICKNCKELKLCIPPAQGSTVPGEQLLATCSDSQTCLTGSCTTETNSVCALPQFDFICTQSGIFPDPNCTQYHICCTDPVSGSIDRGKTETCESDGDQQYGFNLKTLTCNIKLPSNKCPANSWPQCKSNQDTGPLAANANFYYICGGNDNALQLFIRKCPFGRTYSATKGCA